MPALNDPDLSRARRGYFESHSGRRHFSNLLFNHQCDLSAHAEFSVSMLSY